MTSAAVAPDRQAVLRRRIRLLVAATITYNVIEAVVALAAGTIASSVALIGFGLDSVIEVSSAAAVAWQFASTDPQRRERVVLRVIAWSFFALAAYVTVEAVRGLLGAGEAEHSPIGIVLVAISVVVMPFPVLRAAPRRAGTGIGDRRGGLEADPPVHLPVRRRARGPGPERRSRMVVGRPRRRPGVGRARSQGRTQRLARRSVLRTISDVPARRNRHGLLRRLLLVLTALGSSAPETRYFELHHVDSEMGPCRRRHSSGVTLRRLTR
jgi:hypothetical protein